MLRFHRLQLVAGEAHAAFEKEALGARARRALLLIEGRNELDRSIGHRRAQLRPFRVYIDPHQVGLCLEVAIYVF